MDRRRLVEVENNRLQTEIELMSQELAHLKRQERDTASVKVSLRRFSVGRGDVRGGFLFLLL